MSDIATLFRQKDAEWILKHIAPEAGIQGSWIIQGLPGSGTGQVFAIISKKLRETDVILVELNLRDYWTQSVASLIGALLAHLSQFTTATFAKGATLEVLLSQLHDSAEEIACQGKTLVIALDKFDALQKFSEPEEVQHMLNCFQSIGSLEDCQTRFLVSCYKNIEDICQTVNYSDFYKIFGTNHFRVRPVPYEDLLAAIRKYYPNWDERLLNEVIVLSGGFPEHVEVIARYADLGIERVQQESLDALCMTFDEWRDCLTPDEQNILNLVSMREPLGPEHQSGRKQLIRKSILTEVNGDLRITSPLFNFYLGGQVGTIQEEEQTFIRRSGQLPETHQQLFYRLFKGYSYIEWECIQPPEAENATVYLVTGEDKRGIPYRPCVVKIDRPEPLSQELHKTQSAKALLGPLVPAVIATQEYKGQKAIVCELATGDNRDFSVSQFEKFYHQHSAEEIQQLLNRVFAQALFPLYRTQKVADRKYRKYYYLPKFQQGEYQVIEDLCKRSRLYNPDDDTLQLPGKAKSLPNPGVYLRPRPDDESCAFYRLFEASHPMGLCQSHGDMNPRNLLIDGIGNIYLIDFSEMKDEEKGTRFLDIVRLEAETKFKLAIIDSQSFAAFIALEQLLIEACTLEEFNRLCLLPLDTEARKMVAAVCTLRQVARKISTKPVDDSALDYEYKLGLLAQTLRISLFGDYLTEIQQEYAVVSSALLTDWLIQHG